MGLDIHSFATTNLMKRKIGPTLCNIERINAICWYLNLKHVRDQEKLYRRQHTDVERFQKLMQQIRN